MLTVFYDLAVAPPTFDFIKFLLCAKLAAAGQPIDLYVVPGPASGFRDDRLPPDVPMRRRMLTNVVLRYCELHADVTACAVSTRADAQRAWTWAVTGRGQVWPPQYHPDRPHADYSLNAVLAAYRQAGRLPVPQAPAWAQDAARTIIDGRRMVLCVLRECAYWPERNSVLDEWAAFGRWLRDEAGVAPLFVRDAAMSGQAFHDFEMCHRASDDIRILFALLEQVERSYFVNSGVAAMASYGSRAPYRIFKLITSNPCTTAAWHQASGLEVGGQFPWAGHDQRLVWQPDTFDSLKASYEAAYASQ